MTDPALHSSLATASTAGIGSRAVTCHGKIVSPYILIPGVALVYVPEADGTSHLQSKTVGGYGRHISQHQNDIYGNVLHATMKDQSY